MSLSSDKTFNGFSEDNSDVENHHKCDFQGAKKNLRLIKKSIKSKTNVTSIDYESQVFFSEENNDSFSTEDYIFQEDSNTKHRCIPVYKEFECIVCGTKIIVKVRCKSRFCIDCARIRNNELKEVYMPIINAMRKARFITLTIKNYPIGDLDKMRKDALKWLNKLKHRKVFASVTAGMWGFDVTYNHECRSWHLHIHMIVDCDYINQSELSDVWRSITGSFVVDIRLVYSRGKALKELIKYVGKFYEIKDSEALQELKDTFKGKKQCDCWGWARDARKVIKSGIKAKKQLRVRCPGCSSNDQWFYVDTYDYVTAIEKRHGVLWRDYYWSYQCMEKNKKLA